MNMKEETKRPPFEEGLIRMLAAVDKQIAREMQRTPAELEESGVQKWEPYQKRIEIIVSAVLNGLGGDEISLDSLIVFSQAMSKALLLSIEDLSEEGLGKVRSAYCLAAIKNIESDTHRAMKVLKPDQEFN